MSGNNLSSVCGKIIELLVRILVTIQEAVDYKQQIESFCKGKNYANTHKDIRKKTIKLQN